MKIMLIQAEPPDDVQDFNFPMGYAALDSVLTKHGHEVELLFTVAHYLTEDKIARAVKESDAQIFGIGGMWPYLKRVEMLVELIREVRPGAKIVLGGWMTTYLPELVLQKTGADFCVAGEGEVALLQLLNSLEGRTEYSHIKGLVFKQGDRFINNGFGERMPFEDTPMPNWEKFPTEYYMRTGAWYFKSFATGYDRVMGWAASRGCPGKCNFCTPGVAVRYKKMDLLMAELHEIDERFHPTFMYWMDNLTMGSKGYCRKFCEALIRGKFNFRYFITGRVDIVDREMLQLLKESGCVSILYGLESASNDLLKFMNKNTTVEQFVEAVRLTKEAGIGVNISAMFGQPGETLEDFANTLKMVLTSVDRNMPFSNNQGFFPLTTFPGSPIYRWAKENGYIQDEEDYYSQFFEHRWINYTQYPREVVEEVLAIANTINTWNYHYYKSKSLEDIMRAMVALPKVAVDEKRFAILRRFLKSRPRLKSFLKRVLSVIAYVKIFAHKITRKEVKLDTGKLTQQDYRRQVEEFRIQFVREYF